MKAVVKLDVPEWQIGQPVTIYFKDTMMKKGVCEPEQEIVFCKNCKHCYFADNRIPDEQSYACGIYGFNVSDDWFCADGERL